MSNKPKIVATYSYHDADGVLLYESVRYDPKDFRQRRPDEHGGWRWDLSGIERVPYRLPELLAAEPGSLICVVEGEKDADALGAAGLLATTNAGGAGKWRDEFSEPLRGQRVVILPDNDEAGRRHAEAVAASCAGKAASVKVVALPGLAEKGDVSDWLAAGGTVKELLRLAEDAPDWEKPTVAPNVGVLAGRSQGSTWPDPLGEAAFYGLAGRIVRALAPHTEADPAALLINLLVMFGSAAGRNPHFRVGDTPHGTNLYAVLVGETAKGRKGTSEDGPLRVLRAADPEWAQKRVLSGLSSGEGLIHHVRDRRSESQQVKDKGRVVGTEVVVVDDGVDDKRMLVTEGEFASVLKVAERSGNILSATLRQAWDGKDLRTLIKTSPDTATEPHISILGHITKPEVLRYLNATEGANGYANRILWVSVRRARILPEGGRLSDAEVAGFGAEVADALAFARACGELWRDDEARELWAHVYPLLSEGKPGLFGAVIGRAEAQVLRLSMLYALLDRSNVIRAEHLVAALEVWDYCEASARHIFGDATGDPIADRILQQLRSDGPMAQGELVDSFKRHVGQQQMTAALATLEAAALIEGTTEQTGGRPRMVWRAT